jgi:hypothetical protein
VLPAPAAWLKIHCNDCTKKKKQGLFNWIIVASGLVILAVAVWLAKSTSEFIRYSIRISAKGVRNELDWGTGGGTGIGHHDAGYHTIFTFTDPATKKDYQIRDDTSHNPSLYDSGDKITVLYPPGCPEQARIDCFRSLWDVPAVVGGGGLWIFLCGLAAMAVSRFRSRKSTTVTT